MFDFPNAPAIGDRVTGVGGIVYVWDGVKWTSNVGAVTVQSMGDVGRNLIHNSMFNVAQRGAGAFSVSGAYTADRWQMAFGGGTLSVALNSANDTVRSQIGDESPKAICSVTVAGTAGAGDYAIVAQHIEDVRRLAGKAVTVSFWAACGSGTPKIGISIDQHFGNVGSPSPDVNGTGQSVTLGTTYQRYSLTFVLPSVAGKTLGTDATDWTAFQFWFSSGSANNARAGGIGTQSAIFGIWGVQLEIGSVATPLEKPDPQVDLANCQRFYEVGPAVFSGYSAASSAFGFTMLLPVPMRAAPTVVITNVGNVNIGTVTGGALASPSGLYIQGLATAAGNTTINTTFTASADL